MNIVRADENDFERVTAFYRGAIRDEGGPLLCRWVYGLHPDDEIIREYIAKESMYYLERNGILPAAGVLLPRQGEDYHDVSWQADLRDEETATVHLLCVHPAARREGLARRMMTEFIALSRAQGKKALRLDALEKNTPARQLYESLGFRAVDRKLWYAGNTGTTPFILYELLLS